MSFRSLKETVKAEPPACIEVITPELWPGYIKINKNIMELF